MQAQKLNIASTAQQKEAASAVLTPACKLKQASNKEPATTSANHKVFTTTQQGKSGGFSFAGIAG